MRPSHLISIIIPVYNTERYIGRCIESVLKQTFDDWELILVDDGSTDNSLKICQSYAMADSRISILSQPNRGQGAARNRALGRCRGKYVTFVDSDDLLVDSDTFAPALTYLENHEKVDIVQFPFVKFNDHGNVLEPNFRTITLTSAGDIAEHLDVVNMVRPSDITVKTSPWAKVFRRSLFDNIRFPEGVIYEDTFMMCEMLSKINSLAIIDKGMYGNYERAGSTTTGKLSLKKAHDRVAVLTSVFQTLRRYSTDRKLQRRMLLWILKITASFKARCSSDLNVEHEVKSLYDSNLQGGGIRCLIFFLQAWYTIRFKFRRPES